MIFRGFIIINSHVKKLGLEFLTCSFGGLYFLWAKENFPFPCLLKLFPVPWLRHCAEPDPGVQSIIHSCCFQIHLPSNDDCEQNPSESYYLQSKSLKCSGI